MNKTRPSLLWIVALGILLVLAPLFFLWWFRGAAWTASRPIGLYMPDRATAALCLRQPQAAWARHWHARTGPAPEDALKAILEATGTWERWVKKHGEIQSQVRLKLLQEAFFRTIGDEAWLVFGEWGGAQSGEGAAGLVALIRGNTPVLPRVGPLLELLLDEYTLQSSTCEGETVYQYQDKRLGRCLTLCQVGGWVCVSMRRRDAGPLPAIIRRVKAADGPTTRALAPELMPVAAVAKDALVCGWRPEAFWTQLAEFNRQRGRKESKKSRASIAAWKAQLGGIDLVTARQEGDSLLAMRVEARGPRLAALNRQKPAATEPGREIALDKVAEAGGGAAVGEAELARLELDTAAAGTILPHDLMAGMKSAAWFDLFMPGARGRLAAALAGGTAQAGGRIGLAAYAAPTQLVPRMVFWEDRGTTSGRGRPNGAAALNAKDAKKALAMPAAMTAMAAPAAGNAWLETWMKFVERERNRSVQPPQAFASLNFRDLSAGLDKIPLLFMKKKEQKKLKTWKSTMRALALAVGGAAARIDGTGDRWVMTLSTP